MASEQTRTLTANQSKLRDELQATMDSLGLIRLRMEQGRMSSDDLRALIAADHNILGYNIVRVLLNDKKLTVSDIHNCGIDDGFIRLLEQSAPQDPQDFSDQHTIESIPDGFTEVYFWGMRGSGKTCALGAIMSTAKSGSDIMSKHACQGGDYMTRLSQIFRYNGIYTFLPRPTPTSHSYEMRFTLTRGEQEHPLALIDISGEVFQSLFKVQTNKKLQDDEKAALDTVSNLLINKKSKNRKIHFFVVEYGAENRQDPRTKLMPDDHLECAAEFLSKNGVFSELTDAVFIILTKADKAPYGDDIDKQDAYFRNYMSNNYYNFYHNLKRMCEKNDVNGGRLLFVPFSIGEVCFGTLCRFDGMASQEIIDHIMDNSFYYEKTNWGRVRRTLSN